MALALFLTQDRAVRWQWASDVRFDGIRLEAISSTNDVLFDVSRADDGEITVNTFNKDIQVDLIEEAIAIARSSEMRRS